IQETAERPTLEAREPSLAVDGVKGSIRAVFQDHVRPVDPVALLDVREMADDLVGRPRARTFVAAGPSFGEPREHRAKRAGGSPKDLLAGFERELHGRPPRLESTEMGTPTGSSGTR